VTDQYFYFRNGAFYLRYPERVWVLDRSLATVFATWQRGDTPLGFDPPRVSTMRYERANKVESEMQHTGCPPKSMALQSTGKRET
jgi:hypothetical protein